MFVQCPRGMTAHQNPRSSFPAGILDAEMRLDLPPGVLRLGREWAEADAVANPTGQGTGERGGPGQKQAGAGWRASEGSARAQGEGVF